MSINGYVDYKIRDRIAEIEFFHPQSNSLPLNLLSELAEKITFAGEDRETRAVLLKSKGDKAFCAGASFDELLSIKNFEQGEKFFSGFASVINAIRKTPKFVIVRVHGKAVGGGVGLASAGDYAFATKEASIRLSELAVGIGAFVVGPAVQRKMGVSAFAQLSINAGVWKTAEWAREKGLYAEIYPDVKTMDEAIEELLRKIVNYNPEAMSTLKQIFWNDCEHWSELLSERAKISGNLVLSEFTRNAIHAFKAPKS